MRVEQVLQVHVLRARTSFAPSRNARPGCRSFAVNSSCLSILAQKSAPIDIFCCVVCYRRCSAEMQLNDAVVDGSAVPHTDQAMLELHVTFVGRSVQQQYEHSCSMYPPQNRKC
jgi:hypothetical protein